MHKTTCGVALLAEAGAIAETDMAGWVWSDRPWYDVGGCRFDQLGQSFPRDGLHATARYYQNMAAVGTPLMLGKHSTPFSVDGNAHVS